MSVILCVSWTLDCYMQQQKFSVKRWSRFRHRTSRQSIQPWPPFQLPSFVMWARRWRQAVTSLPVNDTTTAVRDARWNAPRNAVDSACGARQYIGAEVRTLVLLPLTGEAQVYNKQVFKQFFNTVVYVTLKLLGAKYRWWCSLAHITLQCPLPLDRHRNLFQSRWYIL